MDIVLFINDIGNLYTDYLIKNFYNLTCCRIASDILGSFLYITFKLKIRIIGGDTIFDNRYKPSPIHVWLMIDEYYIDATIGQYTMKKDRDIYMGCNVKEPRYPEKNNIKELRYPEKNNIFISKENIYNYREVEEYSFSDEYITVASLSQSNDTNVYDCFKNFLIKLHQSS